MKAPEFNKALDLMNELFDENEKIENQYTC